MPPKSRKPSRIKLKKRFRLKNDDFKVEIRAEDAKEMLAERVADFGGFRTWLLRSPVGLVVAVILVFAEINQASTEIPVGIRATAVTAKLCFDALKETHRRPAPKYRYGYFQQYGVTSNSVVSVVTIGPHGLPAPLSLANGSSNAFPAGSGTEARWWVEYPGGQTGST
jgi:hypothetical protein